MLKVISVVDASTEDAQGFKEVIAMDFEKYGGKVRVISVEEIHPEQMRMGFKE